MQHLSKEQLDPLRPHLESRSFVIDPLLRIEIRNVLKIINRYLAQDQLDEMKEAIASGERSFKAGLSRSLPLFFETDYPSWLDTIQSHLTSTSVRNILVGFAGVSKADHTHLALAIATLGSTRPREEARHYYQLFSESIIWLSNRIFGEGHRALQNVPPAPTLTYRNWLVGMMDNPPEDGSAVHLRWLQPTSKQESQHRYTIPARTTLYLQKRDEISNAALDVHLSHLIFHYIKSPLYHFDPPPLDNPNRASIKMKKSEITKHAWTGDCGFYDSTRACVRRMIPEATHDLINRVQTCLTTNHGQATFLDSAGHYFDCETIHQHDAGTDWEGLGSISFGLHFEEEPAKYSGWVDRTIGPPAIRIHMEYQAYQGLPVNPLHSKIIKDAMEIAKAGPTGNGNINRESQGNENADDDGPRVSDSSISKSAEPGSRPGSVEPSTFDLSSLPEELQQKFKLNPQELLLHGNIDPSFGLFDTKMYFLLAKGTFGKFYGSPHKTKNEKEAEYNAKAEAEWRRGREARARASTLGTGTAKPTILARKFSSPGSDSSGRRPLAPRNIFSQPGRALPDRVEPSEHCERSRSASSPAVATSACSSLSDRVAKPATSSNTLRHLNLRPIAQNPGNSKSANSENYRSAPAQSSPLSQLRTPQDSVHTPRKGSSRERDDRSADIRAGSSYQQSYYRPSYSPTSAPRSSSRSDTRPPAIDSPNNRQESSPYARPMGERYGRERARWQHTQNQGRGRTDTYFGEAFYGGPSGYAQRMFRPSSSRYHRRYQTR